MSLNLNKPFPCHGVDFFFSKKPTNLADMFSRLKKLCLLTQLREVALEMDEIEFEMHPNLNGMTPEYHKFGKLHTVTVMWGRDFDVIPLQTLSLIDMFIKCDEFEGSELYLNITKENFSHFVDPATT